MVSRLTNFEISDEIAKCSALLKNVVVTHGYSFTKTVPLSDSLLWISIDILVSIFSKYILCSFGIAKRLEKAKWFRG